LSQTEHVDACPLERPSVTPVAILPWSGTHVPLEGLQESGQRSISCVSRNNIQLVVTGAQSHGCGADAEACEIVLGRLANQFSEFCSERGSGHCHVPR
jgi:hypothetical protein